jgi:uncharacterized membrane protein
VTARRLALGLALFAIAFGIFARVDSLDHKLLWQDEAYSLLRISGHTNKDVDALFDGRMHRASEMFALQRITPERGLRALLRSIASEEPQRGPLYFVLARWWIGIFGNGTAHVRGLSAVLGLFGIGLAFAFGRRAAGSLEGGAFAAALYALAPLQIRLAQQVREYVLVSDLTLLSAFVLLGAVRRPSWRAWLAFAACAIAGLYANLEFAFVLACEAAVATAFLARGWPNARRVAAGGLAALVLATLAYAPWLRAIAAAAARGTGGISWAATSYSLRSGLLKWTFNVGASFFDSEFANVALGVFLVPPLVLGAYALYRIAKGPGDPFVRALVVALVVSSAVPLLLIDAVRHSHYALITRYAMSSWTGLELAVALALAWQIASPNVRVRRFAAGSFAYLAVLGAASVVFDRPYVEWWDDNEHLSEPAVAEAVAASPGTPIVASADVGAYVLVLSRYLDPGRSLLLVPGDAAPRLPEAARFYVFLPSAASLAAARAAAGPASTVQNISPPIGLSIPDLRDAADTQIAAANALWLLCRARCPK